MAQLFYLPTDPVRDANGVVAPQARLTFYVSGTSTLAQIFADNARTVPLANPLTCDGSGRHPPIYMQDIAYRVVITDKNGAPLGDEIPVYIPGTTGGAGPPGVNGGTSAAGGPFIGLFTGAAGQDLTAGGTKPPPSAVLTTGYSTVGKGGACYILDAAVNAAFVTAHPRWSFRDSQGNGYRLDPYYAPVFFESFGAVGGATSAVAGPSNDTAWLAAKDYIHYFRVWPSGNYYYKPSVPINFRPTGYEFSSGTYLDLNDAAYELFGSGQGGAGGGGGTVFFFSNSCGLVLQSWDTAGVNLTNQTNDSSQPYNHGASNSHIRGIELYSRTGTIAAEQHGLIVKCGGCLFESVVAKHFGGFGIKLYGNTPGAGNANCNRFVYCGAHYNGLGGLSTGGGDGNANTFEQFQSNFNRTFGILEGSFLGNKFLSYHMQSNGMPSGYGAGPIWSNAADVPGARAVDGGKTYAVLPGQDALAPTSQPSLSPAVWTKVAETALAWCENWVSGHKYCSGGAVFIGTSTFAQNNNNWSTFTGYIEGDQPPGFNASGSALGLGQGGAGSQIYGWNGNVVSQAIGCRSYITGNASNIVCILGGASNYADQGVFLQLGLLDNPEWFGHLDATKRIYFDFNMGGGTCPFILNPPGWPSAGLEAPRGIKIGNVSHYSAAAAPTSGYYRRGDLFWNENQAAGGTPGWVIVPVTGGDTLAWIATVAWAASTAFNVGDLRTNDTGKSYRCITAGTSAASGGPTGTGANITDGTAHWQYSAGWAAKALANVAA